MFYKWRKNAIGKIYSPPKFGINYDLLDDDGFVIVMRLPLWSYFRRMYFDFETKEIKSGKTILCIQWYFRRRSNEGLEFSKKHGGGSNRFILELPHFFCKSVGKQKILVSLRMVI